MNVPQIGLMIGEILFVTLLFVVSFRLRAYLGLIPVYMMLGVVFYASGLLAASVYVEVAPGIVVSPGSVAFFPAIVFVVLCVYITEDAGEARKLMYSLFITNVFIAGLGWLTAMHLRLAGTINDYHLPTGFFATHPRVGTMSMIALFADTLVIILLYEFVSRFTRSLLLRIYFSMALTLVFDTVLFITGIYVESPEYLHILTSSLIGKTLAAVLYAVLAAIYLEHFDVVEPAAPGEARGLGSMFRVLTYRQKYELLQARSVRDGLTGVYNRAFLDEILAAQVSMAARTGNPLAFLMVDLDHFKHVNDDRGHTEGDRVLREVAQALAATFRSSDFVCRYGGEEFGIVIPNTSSIQAFALAEKARSKISEVEWTPSGSERPLNVTATIGVAALPEDAVTADELVKIADERLYEGKLNGRNQVIAGIAAARIA